jgi:threonine synthase
MTTAISCALAEGAEAVVCASTGNTSASMAAYAAAAGLKPLVLVPEGKIAAGKMAQALMHGAQVIMVRGNFDDCLRMAREMAWHYPVALVNSGQPGPARGAEDRGVRDRRLPRRRPRLPPAAGRQRRQHLGVLARLPAVRGARPGHQAAGDARLPGRGRGAAGDRRAVPRPGDQGHRDPDRQPRLVEARRGGARRVRRPVRVRLRRADPGRQKELASRDGVFVEPASAAGIAGMLQDIAQRESYVGSRVVVTVTGHGLKDTATALKGSARWSTWWSTPTSPAAAEAAGLERIST